MSFSLQKRIYLPFALILLITLCFPGSVAGQQKATFKGTIVDAEDGTPLIGANVKLRKDFSTGTVCDQEGRFSLQLAPGTYTFILSFIGMETDSVTLSLKAGETLEKQFMLVPVSNELEEVDVRVSKFDKKIEDITVSMEVLKPRLIENKNTRSIETVLDYTPGLNITG